MTDVSLVQVTVSIQFYKSTMAQQEWFIKSGVFSMMVGEAEDPQLYGLDFQFMGDSPWPNQPSPLAADFKMFGESSITEPDLNLILDEADARFADLRGLDWINRHEHMTPVPGFWPIRLLCAFEVEEIEDPGEFNERSEASTKVSLLGFLNQRQATKRRTSGGPAELGFAITVPNRGPDESE